MCMYYSWPITNLILKPSSCRRLNLTSLAYLWQRDQAELLSEMIEAGMEAILIKVAGIGLQSKHLGKTLAQMQPTLTLLVCFDSGFCLFKYSPRIARTNDMALISAVKAGSTRA
jgi:hypothetical protein